MIIHLSTRHRQRPAPLSEPEPDGDALPQAPPDWDALLFQDEPDGPATDPPEKLGTAGAGAGPDPADHPIGACAAPTLARVNLGTPRVDPAGGATAGAVAAILRRGVVAAECIGASSAAEAGVELV